ncbi:FAD-dependent oxidoreductase [Opitutaceae bacterium TAV3]|nr:FAD-dependent oxidoreductase [Opitutaceae bacterium TAV3]
MIFWLLLASHFASDANHVRITASRARGGFFTLPQSNPQRDPYLHAIHSRLNISYSRTTTQLIPAPDSGEGDGLVQAINYRTILSTNPANRVLPRRPDDYDPSEYSKFEYKTRVREIPNDKVSWNRPQLIGLQNAYVEGNWATRRKVLKNSFGERRSVCFTICKTMRRCRTRNGRSGVNTGSRSTRESIRKTRLARFTCGKVGRLKGRSILTESDALLAPGLPRSSLHADAIAFADWYIDCHACTAEKIGESRFEGTMTLFGECFPCQIPYGCIVAETFANVLAPVCLSATHVAFGAVRLEPAWMNLGESAGYAAALAMRQGVTPAEIKADDLVAHLARSRVSLIFFNDIGLSANEAWFPAIQYWGTKGFFPCFDARPHDKLTEKVAQQWLEIAGKVSRSDFDPNAAARTVMAMETGDLPLSASAWREMLQTRGFVSQLLSPPPPPPPPPARRH